MFDCFYVAVVFDMQRQCALYVHVLASCIWLWRYIRHNPPMGPESPLFFQRPRIRIRNPRISQIAKGSTKSKKNKTRAKSKEKKETCQSQSRSAASSGFWFANCRLGNIQSQHQHQAKTKTETETESPPHCGWATDTDSACVCDVCWMLMLDEEK